MQIKKSNNGNSFEKKESIEKNNSPKLHPINKKIIKNINLKI